MGQQLKVLTILGKFALSHAAQHVNVGSRIALRTLFFLQI
jgi:hypothetical protein